MQGRARLHHTPGVVGVVQQAGHGARGSGRACGAPCGPGVWCGAGVGHGGCLPWDHLANSSGRMVGPHTSWDASWMASHSRLGRSVMLQGGDARTHTRHSTPSRQPGSR